jgi:hypothetical protein
MMQKTLLYYIFMAVSVPTALLVLEQHDLIVLDAPSFFLLSMAGYVACTLPALLKELYDIGKN